MLGVRAADDRIARILVPKPANVIEKRVTLLAQARTLRSLATFGFKNRAQKAKINAVTKDVIAALDKAGATRSSVDAAINASLKRNK